jgi:hypothetical protein
MYRDLEMSDSAFCHGETKGMANRLKQNTNKVCKAKQGFMFFSNFPKEILVTFNKEKLNKPEQQDS